MTEFRPGRFQVLPPVVKNLVIINSLMLFLTYVLGKYGIDLNDILGLHYWHSSLYRPWQLVTHMFMHGNLMHLFSNMFALWMFGSILENIWGGKRFFIFYMICGLGAALLHLAVLHFEYNQIEKAFLIFQQNPTLDQFQLFIQQHIPKALPDPGRINNILRAWNNDPGNISYSNQSIDWIHDYLYGFNQQGYHVEGLYDTATIGASGAIFGVLFAFGYLFPNTLLYIYFLVPIKAKYVVGAYALFELFSGVQNSAGDNIAHFAHLGGMLVAFIILKIWNERDRKNFY